MRKRDRAERIAIAQSNGTPAGTAHRTRAA
jgi:hypothetical protein